MASSPALTEEYRAHSPCVILCRAFDLNFMSEPSPSTEPARASGTPEVRLRAAGPQDCEFLLRLYTSTREEEMAAWGWTAAQREAFLQMQFVARERFYDAAYPAAERQIILLREAPAGAMIVFRNSAEIRLVDIALLPEQRNRGTGAKLIGELIREASGAGLPLKLTVLRANPAARLYARLGFERTGEDAMYLHMERRLA